MISMNPVLERILRTGCVESSTGERREVSAHIPREEGEFLQKLIMDLKPKVSLEIGLAYGISSLFICDALVKVQAERHIVADLYQREWANIGLHNLAQAGYENLIEFYELSSHRLLPRLESEGRLIDFAFVDGWHTFDYTMVEFFFIDKILRVGGIIAFDDTRYPSIRKLCRYIATNHAYAVLPQPGPPPPQTAPELSWKVKLLRRLLGVPGISRYSALAIRPEILQTDAELGLPAGNFIAFRKEAEDVLGDGSNGTRRWDFYREF